MSSPLPPALQAASEAIRTAIIKGLNDARGVHAETAVIAAARLAGMFLFRSFKLELGPEIQPGAPVLSEEANHAGPALLQLLGGVTDALGLKVNPRKIGEPAPLENQPLIDTLATEQKLEPAIEAIRRKLALSDQEAAQACAIAAGLVMCATQQVLDVNIAFSLAVRGFVEGSKTAPVPRSNGTPG